MNQDQLQKIVEKAIKKQFPELDLAFSIETPRSETHGDYSTNIAFKVAREIKGNPVEIAKQIAESIEKDKNFSKIQVLEPGFINFFLSDSFFEKEVFEILEKKEKYGSSSEKNKVVVIDYSSPNIAKSFGIGHLRSTVIGQALYNIYRFRGWKCIGDNHLGDWGTQFGKLIYQIKEKKLKNVKEKKKVLEELTIKELEKLYVDFHKEAQDNPDLEKQGRFWFEKLESGDKEAQEIWQVCVETSKKEFDRIYDLLNVKIDYAFGESFYSQMIPDVVTELKKKNIAVKSQGALIVSFDDNKPPIIVVKSDGATTYLARDLATIKYRIKKWNPDLFIYEVGVDQSLYFKQLFETAEKLNWKNKESFVHVAHGLVRWKGGKFSTRKGETIHLEEVLNQAIDKSFEIIEQSKNVQNLSLEQKKETARKIGIGAVKYNDLSQGYQKDIVFDWEKMLNLKGDSGPYIQYTFARCQSVLKKSGFEFKKSFSLELEQEEKKVLRELIKFKQAVKDAEENFSPNIVCNFLFSLAQEYNLFYNNNQIIKEEERTRTRRIILTLAVAQVLQNGLNLLGIEAPEKM
jgi:arginyl-tRNA synthetase